MKPHRSPLLSLTTVALVAAAQLALAGCQRTPTEPHAPSAPAAPTAPQTEAPAAPGAPPTAGREFPWHHGLPAPQGAAPAAGGELSWTDPGGWQRETPSSPMRRAQYRIPNAGGEAGDAELTVITFGPGQGGNVESNLNRWFLQVTQPDGRPTSEVASRRTMTVNGLNITIAEAPGRLGGGGGPAMPGMPAAPSFEHGRLLAAIVETPQGPWFFKMTGPDQTVAHARPAFESLLSSLQVH
jgi:hypothetical protein